MNPYASYVTRTFLRSLLLILLTAIFYSCNPTEKGKISVDFGEFKDRVAKNNQNFSPKITSAVLVDDELKITGTGLLKTKNFSLSGIGSDKDLSVVSKSDTEVTLSSGSPFALLLDTTLSLILEDAYGNTTVVGITFNLPDNSVTTDKIADGTIETADLKDGAVTSAKLDSMGASNGQFLKYTGAGWTASDLQALTYAGNFDASGAPLAAGNPNEYYIVTVAGSADLAGGNGTDSWQIGDWAVWNDPAGQWEKIEKGSGVTSFNLRNGPVVPVSGDYDWSMIGNLAGAYLDYRPNNVPCADGTLLAWDNTNTRWDCFTLPADQDTTYTAGTGLDLTGTAFSIASQGVTNTMISGIASNCSSGQVLKADGSGGFNCAADAGAGGADASSLRGETLDTNLATNTTTDGQILVWSQTNNRWEVGTIPADQDTTYTAGTGLTLSTTTFNVDVGTTSGKIVQLDGTGLPAVDGSQLTGLTKTQVGLGNVSNSLQLLDSNKVTVIDGTSDNTGIPSALAVKNYVDGSAVTSLTVDQINSGAGLYFGYLPNNVACTPGQVLEWDNANTRWVCGTKTVDTDTTYTAGTGLTLTGTQFDVDVGTGANQIVQLDGAAALPAVDGSNLTDVVAVSADTALAVENDDSVVINADNSGDTTGDINFQINSTTQATLLNNGNFGLGTTTPLAKFEVVAPASDGILIPNGNALLGRGSSGITQILYWGSNTAYWGRNTSDVPGGTGDVVNSHFFRTNGTDRLSIISNGNVGVGTIAPQSKLDVAGVIRAEQICDETGANCHDLSAGTNTSGTVTSVATGAGLTGGPITSTGTIAVDVGTTANKIPQLDGSGKLATSVETDPTVETFAQTTLPTCGVGEVLKGDGTSLTCVTDANTIYTGGTGIGIDGSQVITVTQSDINTDNVTEGSTNKFSQWLENGSDIYYNAGDVGIGTTAPATNLHVEGAVDYGSLMIGGNTAGNNHHLTHETDGSFRIFDGVFGSGQTRFMIDADGKVGIGTTTPIGNLDVSGGLVFRGVPLGNSGGTRRYWKLFTLDGETSVGGASVSAFISGTGDYGNRERGTIFLHVGERADVLSIQAYHLNVDKTNDPIEFYYKRLSAYEFEVWALVADWNHNHSLQINSLNKTVVHAYDSDAVTTTDPTGLTQVNIKKIIADDGSGNVGIGTDTPTTALEVVGTVKATAFEGPVTSSTATVNAGTAAAPSYTFAADANTGFYSSGADQIGVSVNGTNIFDFTTTGITSNTTGGALITTAAGTASDPTFSFSGDADTGWFSPAADNLAATTGGSERIRINSSGNVGIGTTNPTYPLDVSSSNATPLTLRRTGSSNNTNIRFNNTGGDVYVGAYGNQFGVGPNADLNSSPWLRINNSGDVGLGTTTPGRPFHVLDADDHVALFESSDTRAFISLKDDSTTTDNAVAVGAVGNDFVVRSGSADRLRLTSTGNLGIGTSTPVSKLSIVGASGGIPLTSTHATNLNSVLNIDNNATDGSITIKTHDRGVGNSHGALKFVTSPDAVNTSWSGIRGLTGSNGDAANLAFYTASSNSQATAAGASTERMRIDKNGNVGIGATNPRENLEILGTGVGTEAAALLIANTDSSETTGSSVALYLSPNETGTTRAASVKSRIDNIASADNSADLGFFTAGGATPVERMTITSGGNVGIGVTTPEAKLDIIPGGVATTTYAGRNINYGANLTSLSGRSGYTVKVSNNYTNADDNAGFQWLFPFDSGGNDNYKPIRVSTGSTLNDVFYVKQNGDGYFAGNIGVGTTLPSETLHLNSATGNEGTNGIFIQDPTANAPFGGSIYYDDRGGLDGLKFAVSTDLGEQGYIYMVRNSGRVGIGTTSPSEALEVNGNVKAASFLHTSDARLKENVSTLGNAARRVASLRGVQFDWIESGETEHGFIAQEVESAEPLLVVTADSGLKSVKYASMTALLVEAFKEIYPEISKNTEMAETLSSEIEAIKEDVAHLKREVASLKEENQVIKDENKKLREEINLIKDYLKLK